MTVSESRLTAMRASSPRIALADAPGPVRSWVERSLGSPVVEARTQRGGFSPGVAARVRCADGSRAFVKAVGPELNPDTPGLVREEIEVLGQLPRTPLRPEVLDSYDHDGWVGLLLEDIDGAMPDLPWRTDQLERVLAALDDLGALLTPSPWAAAPRLGVRLGAMFTRWEEFAAADRELLDPWSERHLDRLVELGRHAAGSMAEGSTLCHVDVRSDNILLTTDRVVFVDWNWAGIGPAWFDAALLLLQVRAAGGQDADAIAADHPLLRTVEPEVLTAFVAAMTGMLLRSSLAPAPAGLPTIRGFQAAYAEALLEWTKVRTGWR